MLRLIVVELMLCGVVKATGNPNLLTNSDLETGTTFKDKTAGWFRRATTASLSTDSYTGNHSVRVSARTQQWGGMAHNVDLEAGKNYMFSAYIKLLNTDAGKLTEEVRVVTSHTNTTTGKKTSFMISSVRYMQPNLWQQIGADFTAPLGYDSTMVKIWLDSTEVEYLLDASSLALLDPLPTDWRTSANSHINSLRKANISIVVTSGDPTGVTVQLSQTSSEFAFGTAVSAAMIVDSQYEKYQDFFTGNFEWATIENKLKWKMTEKEENVLTYDEGTAALDWLVARGKQVRGHAVFWGVTDKNPGWVQGLQKDNLTQAMDSRLTEVVNRTKGKVEHWDVNNENLHGFFYEEVRGDVNLTFSIFEDVHQLDPQVKLFLNDFAVVRDGFFTQAYVNQARMFKENPSTHIYGLGIQSHMTPPLDLSLVKHRLDALASVGLPLWITELDIKEPDSEKKADLLEDVLTLYFSHPAVEGVVLWGFWDQKMANVEGSLADGENCTANAAGLIWQKLVRQDWRSSATLTMDTGNSSIRAFKGDYSLKVMRGETLLETKQFTLSSAGNTINIEL